MNNMGYFDNSLQHHGIRGQKWGVRRFQNADGSYTAAGRNRRNENYSDQQYGRDKTVYGTLAARRINRNMNKGDMVSTARSKEAARIAKFRGAGTVAGTVGGTAVGIGLALGGSSKVRNIINKATKYKYSEILRDGTAASQAVDLGISAIAGMAGVKIGHSGAMLAGGYSPSKYRE